MADAGKFQDRDILVVDAQSGFGDEIGGMLRKLGCVKVRCVDRGMQALSEVCRQHPDFILMDVLMPGMDGLTASTVIREYEAVQGFRSVLVGLLSGRIESIHEYCLEAGMDACLEKPVYRRDLERILRGWRMSPENF